MKPDPTVLNPTRHSPQLQKIKNSASIQLRQSENNEATQITRTVNVESSYVENVSLLTNGSFDDSTGWTVVNQYGTDVDGNGVVTINDGKVTFSETVSGPWSKHMGIYTSAQLASGIYQFDMQMDYAGIEQLWGEV